MDGIYLSGYLFCLWLTAATLFVCFVFSARTVQVALNLFGAFIAAAIVSLAWPALAAGSLIGIIWILFALFSHLTEPEQAA